METHSSLPIESHAQEPAKLILEAASGASRSTDGRQTQLASQFVRRDAEMELGALGPDHFGGQPGEEETGIGAVGQTDASRRAHAKAMPPVDPLEPVDGWFAVRKSRENQDTRHEAEGTGCKSVSGLERETVPCCPYASHQRQHLTAER